MKNPILLFIILATTSVSSLFAQKEFAVAEHSATMSLGDRTGYTIAIDGMSEKDLIKSLKNWVSEKQKKASFEETGKHEISAKQILLEEFSSTPVDVYFLFEESKDIVKITGFFNVGGIFVSSSTNTEKSTIASEFMKKFGQRTEKLKITATLEIAQKDLEKKMDEKKELEKKNDQLNKTVEECTETIEQAKKDIDQNQKDQSVKSTEIKSQETAVETIQGQLNEYEGL